MNKNELDTNKIAQLSASSKKSWRNGEWPVRRTTEKKGLG